MNPADFKKRSGVILLILMVWGFLAAAHVVYYSYWKRGKLLEESRYLAWREGNLPAMRGRILDKNGVKLAWSELTHDLYLSKAKLTRRRSAVFLPLLQETFAEPLLAEEEDSRILLRRALSPDEILKLRRILQRFPELELVPRSRRMNVGYPEIQAKIGKTENRPDPERETGISGWEAQYDRELAGTSGVFRVMLDRNGAWVPGTIEILTPPIPGKDVTLPVAIQELRTP